MADPQTQEETGTGPFWARSGPSRFPDGTWVSLAPGLTCIPMLLPLPGEGSGADMLPQSLADRWMDFCNKNPSCLGAAAGESGVSGDQEELLPGPGNAKGPGFWVVMTGAGSLGNRMCSRHPLTTDWLGAAGEKSALEEGAAQWGC